MSNLTDLTISQALEGLEKKEFSSVDLTEAYIENSVAGRHLNCYITETFDIALEEAKASDARRASGKIGALEGIPITNKDLFCTKGIQTTAASKILEGFIPPYESTVSQKLKDAGTICLGKVNLDEFAMGCSTESSAFGPTISPWKRNDDATDLVPGGSSGGSAASVAARMCLASTGTDTGGSIRQPAAFSGIVGIRPTYGRCSRWGIVAFASSLDQAGCFARNVEDAARVLKEISGHDPKDSTSAPHDVPDFPALMKGDVKGLRIGIPKEYRIDGLSDEISKLWDQGAQWLKEQGAEIVDISLPNTKYALAAYYVINPSEASSNLARYDGVRYGLRVEGKDLNDTYSKTRGAGFGDEVKRRIMVGTYALSAGYYDAYYVKAQQVRRLVLNDFEEAYKQCDVILTPTTPSAAFGIGEQVDDPIQMYLNDVFTVTVNLAGLPGISVPAGINKDGLPLGLQLIGKAWDEATLFNTARAIEQAANFTAKPQLLTQKAA